MANLIIILGDQLSQKISSLNGFQKQEDDILMMEVKNESQFIKHHIQKIVFFFSAMRHFALELKSLNFAVNYFKINHHFSNGNFGDAVVSFLKESSKQYKKIIITHPGEYRLLQEFLTLKLKTGIEVEIREDDRFICSLADFKIFANGKKKLIMEFFYREIRKKTKILMFDNGKKGLQPIGEKFNFDAENRVNFKKFKDSIDYNKFKKINEEAINFNIDDITKEVLSDVKSNFSDHFGDINKFNYATTKKDANIALKYFFEHKINNFGNYQDVMISNEAYLFHSNISQYLNIGLLDPLEVCKQAEQLYFNGSAPLNAVEGFIRQIIGWREFIRGIYWLKMPEYQELNFFNHRTDLPDFFWNENKTKMNCLYQVIKQTRLHSYSHHIQRLMITGNFSLLAKINPKQVADWYLAVYADAIEWVELPNVNGMALFADGGIVATKPYISSGSYINKMSNFCDDCQFSIKDRFGDNACPFNYLYWNFLLENKKLLNNNHRLALAYRNLDNFDSQTIEKIQNSANKFLNNL